MTTLALELLRSHRNRLFRIIEEKGLDPGRFAWTSFVRASSTYPRLEVSATPYFFEFWRGDRGEYSCNYSPGAVEHKVHEALGDDLRDYFGVFGSWVDNVKRELDEPDLWELLTSHLAIVSEAPEEDTSNQAFTVAEYERIIATLNGCPFHYRDRPCASP